MLTISACTFGGGFVIVNFMKRRFVDELKWLDEEEMMDITAMAQSCPGAIAVNAAIQVGWKVAGLPGFIVATLGTIIPPIAILSIISFFYNAFASNTYVAYTLMGMQAGVAAVIIDVCCSMGIKIIKEKSIMRYIIMLTSFILAFVLKFNVVYIILGAAFLGLIVALLKRNKGGVA